MRHATPFVLLPLLLAACADAPTGVEYEPGFAATSVPGHQKAKYDLDGNGFPDAGVYVVGTYASMYADDADGDYYWDLGDGRIYKTVPDIDALDPATRTVCDYHNQYRADFGNDPFMNAGWIINNINCRGWAPGTYHYLIVHRSDPRYRGIPANAVWGTWEYHVLTASHWGNLVERLTGPQNHH